METVLRAALVYLLLRLLMRMAGRRTLAQATPFDVVLLIVVGVCVGRGLANFDSSLTACLTIVVTLLAMDRLFHLVSYRLPSVRAWLEGSPIVLVEKGEPDEERLRAFRISSEEVLEAARLAHGLESMAEIRYAILERSGDIGIVPERAEEQSSASGRPR